MPFKFKLQKALDYREHLEEEAKMRLAAAEKNLRDSRKRRDAIQEEIDRAEAKAASEPFMQSGERWLLDQYMKGLRADLAAAEMDARMKEQIVAEARNVLAARAMDRKILDKLKERQNQQFIRQEQTMEQHFNDEIATLRHKT